VFCLKYQSACAKQSIYRRCNIRRIVQAEPFPYRYNYIHARQLTTLGTIFLKEPLI